MFEATCDRCGSRCEVPFRPNGEKPVFCRACFGKNDGGRVDRNPDQFKAQFDILNAKLDKIMRALIPAQIQEAAIVKKPMKEAAVTELKEAPPQKIAVEGKPTEDTAVSKTKKTVGKKTSAKKAAKTGK